MQRKAKAGFTLIELVVVIAIIGILAGLALPKFVALQADARLAKVNAAVGSVKAAAAMAHAALITKGFDANYTGTPTPNITMEGTSVVYVNGYPDLSTIVPISGLGTDYVTTAGAGKVTVAPDANHTGTGTPATPNCTFDYNEAASGAQPTYTVNATLANCG
jgi:MSHA pilin protein MshA